MASPPPSVEEFLPDSQMPVLTFLAFKLPTVVSVNRLMRPEKFVSNLPPTVQSICDVARQPAPPWDIVVALQKLVSKTHVPSIICPHKPTAGHQRYPVSLVHYWAELNKARTIQTQWQSAFNYIHDRVTQEPNSSFLQDVITTLSWLPWFGQLPLNTHGNTIDIPKLTSFFTPKWLTDDHELLMLDLLKDDLSERQRSTTFIENTHFTNLLFFAYQDKQNYSTTKHFQWLRQKGDDLASGQKMMLATVVNKQNIHWTSLVIDFKRQQILYGDSLHHSIEPNLKKVLDWWISEHTNGVQFMYQTLPTSTQSDSYSCGVFAWDAVRCFLLNEPLVETDKAANERLRIYQRLVSCWKDSKEICCRPASNKAEQRLVVKNQDINTPLEIEAILSNKTDDIELPHSGSQKGLPDIRHDTEKKLLCKSSIRTALEKEKPSGLLLFFHKATPEEHAEAVARSAADAMTKAEDLQWEADRSAANIQRKRRRDAVERQQKHRKKIKNQEITAGLRSANGTKIKRSELHLDYPQHLDQGGSVAKLSRPTRELNEKYKNKHRKPQGRKQKKEERPVKYHNWFTPFLFKQIEHARIHAGGLTWSTRAIVSELQKKDYSTFKGLSRSTINGWIDRSGATPQWSDRTLARIKHGNETGHGSGGRKGVLANHPEIVDTVKWHLEALREHGAQISVVSARSLIIATIMDINPSILETEFYDGSTFRASESFVRKWLRDMNWSQRKATQASQKTPDDAEDQCEKSFFRKVYAIKEEDIPAALFVNTDQTQVVYAPGDKMTWTASGAKQVQVQGGDEKRAFTLVVSVASDGTALPMQAVYAGKTHRVLPSMNSTNYDDLTRAGFLLEESGTTTYWSNHKTMHSLVDNILAPYFDKKKAELGLPKSQKSLWNIDVWAVHRSEEFRTWVRTEHPTIIIDFVPGGCTGIFQPCDVGIQRPLKLSIKRSYHEDVVSELLDQMKADEPLIRFDTRLGTSRDRSTRWIWNAYQAVNNENLVKMAFEKCEVRGWNLSYNSLTSAHARAQLREIKVTDPGFWLELTTKQSDEVAPPGNAAQPEDIVNEEEEVGDDCDVPIPVVIAAMTEKKVRKGYLVGEDGRIEAAQMAEQFEPDESIFRDELGRGKRHRRPNQLYSSTAFWRHDHDSENN